MKFPVSRPRRLRKSQALRDMVRETAVSVNDLICPLFVKHGRNVKIPIQSMPGYYQLSVDHTVKEAREINRLGIKAVILFGIPDRKDALGSMAYAPHGIIQETVQRLKDAVPELVIITDVCLCEYTDHGHCGVVKGNDVDNDATLELLARMALSHAQAGADMVAPSDMMDGRVGAIRKHLDENGFSMLPIMSYAAKYASSFYGPFREAAESAPSFGDRKTYQMDPANAREAFREVELDVQEGADLVMVKPALPYLDVITRLRSRFDLPIAAYNVSGEYALVKAAEKLGWIDGPKVMMECLCSIKRAGADLIVTYFAKEVAKVLKGL
ncbi:MAG: porphobilinogen synthase [Deltaproteobacteria bacterium]|nr:porphobilinogen synthase [Deltaproteobacteria bacterium]